ncbi:MULTISPECIES: type I-E CRISPR-associated protein Cse2/CasB [Streptomyces]|uniref:Type I-E CRISPR-associated protein Cse2/CasB n=1 Tax=Streptomyces evansiae TaxID=3075535 RepID=A0ABU2QTJ3_9ACTN|nr:MULTISPECIES: type I-E CRISPR-associated protein Cse2/CasB [unclassified Streptomyces]MDT0407738.1 type I-E CRISPR-associated protein Cse2/CasB [Streptomyces sp. DSM 41979]MYQ61470.1 type I-E CRISPR-associated protein Cse2/CasB [Streptomyces sp. SID4926]SCE58930.1 CRISPR system Cascade subunit CasB [Streptomyces sp. DfronAA-171]
MTAPVPTRRDVYEKYVAWINETCATDPGARVALRRGLRRDLDDVRGLHRIVAAWLPHGVTPEEERAYYAVAAMIADQPRHAFSTADTAEPDEDEEPAAGGDRPTGEGDARTEESDPRTHESGVPAQASDVAPVAGVQDQPPAEPSAASRASARRKRRDSLGASFARAVAVRDGGLREESAEKRLNLLTRQSLAGLHQHLPGNVRMVRATGAGVDFAALLSDLAGWPYRSKEIQRRWLQDYYRTRSAHQEKVLATKDTLADDDA